jgi:hypothetical protein
MCNTDIYTRLVIVIVNSYNILMSVIIQLKNLISLLFSKMLKIRIYKTILPAVPVGVESCFYFEGRT